MSSELSARRQYMGEINIPRDEQVALAAIDVSELEQLIEQAIDEERSGSLHRLPLANCGSYIATQLRYFEKALAEHRSAKAPRKREQTIYTLRRAGRNLSFAVRGMKHRMETEQREGLLFFIDDQIMPPISFTKHLSVRVSYRWRRAVDDEWTFGSITFIHDADLRPNYIIPNTKKKPSAAKQKAEEQTKLHETWDYLMKGALYSVKEYFREGGDGDKIPATFQATVDSHSRGLNNHSTRFWRQQP